MTRRESALRTAIKAIEYEVVDYMAYARESQETADSLRAKKMPLSRLAVKRRLASIALFDDQAARLRDAANAVAEIADQLRAELEKLQPPMQGEKVKP